MSNLLNMESPSRTRAALSVREGRAHLVVTDDNGSATLDLTHEEVKLFITGFVWAAEQLNQGPTTQVMDSFATKPMCRPGDMSAELQSMGLVSGAPAGEKS